MLLFLLVLFILVPIAELYVIVQIGEAIGIWWTLALLVADSVLGSMLMRSQGRVVWRRFQGAVMEGRLPGREVVDGVLVIFGGALLLAPGFITDVFGLLFLLPPSRRLMRGLLVRRAALRMMISVVPGSSARTRRNGRPDDVDGTAVDIDPRLDPPR